MKRARRLWTLVALSAGTTFGCQQCDSRLDVSIVGMGTVVYGGVTCTHDRADRIDCPPVELKEGAEPVVITATPASGWRLGSLSVNGELRGTATTTVVHDGEPCRVEVVFVTEYRDAGFRLDGGRDARRDGPGRDARRDGPRPADGPREVATNSDGTADQGPPCAAGKVELGDQDFPIAKWTSSKTSTSPAASTFTVQQKPSGGASGSYLSFDLDNGGSGTICVLSLHADALYDPQTKGAATNIHFSLAAATPGSVSSNLQTAFSVAAMQGGKLFWVGSERLFVAYKDGWVKKDTWSHATLRLYPSQTPTAGLDLAGGPIQFGVLVCASGKRVDSGVDAFQVTICQP